MLKHLHIENYALIESLDIDFDKGFSVITGETGAGKSILLGAIGLLTGERADMSAIQTGKQRCVLEATFVPDQYGLKSFFEEHDLDYDPNECIVRRELTTNGKSRAFINDTPTTISALKQLGANLIDIHSQHQNLLLGQEYFQFSILDTVGGEGKLLQKYTEAYRKWRETAKELSEAQDCLANGRKDEDYLRFQLNELQSFKPQHGEDDELRQQCDILEHAQDIKLALSQGYCLLSEGENPALESLRQVRNQISSLQKFFPQAEELAERLESCRLELEDISSTLESEAEGIEYDPHRLEQMQLRQDTLFSLEQKHRVDSSDQLICIMQQLEQQLDQIDNSDEHIRQLQEQEKQALQEVLFLGEKLTKVRQKAAKTVEKETCSTLKHLGMPNVRFQVDITPTDSPTTNGMDKVAFLFSANLGSELQNISHVASGGETARVMLSLKALLSGVVSLPTIIFDEIDTGVSGHIAEAMARIMHNMGQQGRQVISITHLPQIAALGQNHYKVWKEDSESFTRSHISALTQEQRITEIANMLSGSNVSTEAINNARALLGIKE